VAVACSAFPLGSSAPVQLRPRARQQHHGFHFGRVVERPRRGQKAGAPRTSRQGRDACPSW
ncbi:hypothetical protein A6R68_17905, partial [Neotoma lepida]